MKLNQSTSAKKNTTGKIAIILPRFNDKLGSTLLANTIDELVQLGVKESDIKTYRVPGTLELPFATEKVATSKKFNAIIALGIVIRGETSHFELVTQTAHAGLIDVSLAHGIPVIFGILAVENEKQAVARVEKSKMNKGKEFAQAAIEMVNFKT